MTADRGSLVPARAGVQLFPALEDATEAALRASIERFGVIVPVVEDQDGRILDGHHRARIATSLGIAFPVETREVADDAEAREIARTLNADRRHLTPEQRRPVVIALKQEGHTNVAIGKALGVSESLVRLDIQAAQSRSPATLPDRVVRQDGKSYPATVSPTEPEPARRASGRPDKTAAYAVTKPRHAVDAEAQKRRLITAFSEINGLCLGLREIDYGKAVAAMTPEEQQTWARQAQELIAALRQTKTRLLEASRNGEHA